VINAKDQIIGPSFTCGEQGPPRAYLWDSGRMIDLNDYVPPGTRLNIFIPHYLTDKGEIAVDGLTPDGDERAALLIPCGDDPPNAPGCRGPRNNSNRKMISPTATGQKPVPLTRESIAARRRQLGFHSAPDFLLKKISASPGK
jgi:probable HAF family extracellular repeat protein